MTQANPLRFGPLGPKTAHLCIDMQNLFAEDTPWHTPWMNRVLPIVVEIAECVVLASDALCSSSDKTHDALMTLYSERFSEQIETAETETILAAWPS
jgi:nicotinamidase-related amidase